MGNRFGRGLLNSMVFILGFAVILTPLLFLNGCGNGPGAPIQQENEQLIITFVNPFSGGVSGEVGNSYNGSNMNLTFMSPGASSVTSMGLSVYPGSIGQFAATFSGPVTFNYTLGSASVTGCVANPTYLSATVKF